MTRNSALKKQVRARMSETGENYTTALRAVTTDTPRPIADAMQPGTVTLAINGGGQANAALFARELARLARAGHQLFIRPLTRGVGIETPDVLDLAVAADAIPRSTALAATDDVEIVRAATTNAFPHPVLRIGGQMPFASLRDELDQARERTGKPPVLYVQDVQEGGAVLVSPYDNEVAQVQRLRELAVVTGAIIAAGHCMPHYMEESWSSAAAAADTTFAIETHGREAGDLRDATLHRYARGRKLDDIRWTIDHSPFSWRQDLYRRERAAG